MNAPRTPGSGDRYVVGIDGSAQSIDALRWTARTAAGTFARIEVIAAWEPRVGLVGIYTAQINGTSLSPEDEARALLSRVANGVYGTDDPPNVTLRTCEGHAAGVWARLPGCCSARSAPTALKMPIVRC